MVRNALIPPETLSIILNAHGVSERETQALLLALEGLPHHKIAEQLGIMPDAARKRLGEIYRKFGIKGRGSGKLAKLQQILLTEAQAQILSLQTSASAGPDISNQFDWGNAPEPAQFFGRTKEVETLQSHILQDKTPLISIVGLKGIGKTALAIQTTEQCKDQFDAVFWRSLDTISPQSLSSTIAEFLTFVRSNTTIQDENNLESLMECLRHHRCLLILDGFEAILSHPPKKAEPQLLETLLQRIGTERHDSCLILTSRENPKEVVELEGRGHPVFSLNLGGLESADASQLLSAKNLADDAHWSDLIDLFQGNPLALQLIAMRIHRFFGGQVSEFLQQETITLQQIEDLVSNQFQYLSDQEREVLSWLALKHEPLSFSALKKALDWPGSRLLSTLESLVRRSLLQGESRFEIQPIVRKYILHYLKTEGDLTQLPQNNQDIQALLERCLFLSSQNQVE